MEPRGRSGVVKPINVDPNGVELHDTDSSELSASTASNSTLPQLEATDAEKAQNEEERRRRWAARKEKREAREKKKKEQQRLEEKKARKEERRLKREARKKKGQEAKASNASSSELSSSSKDGDYESYQVHSKKDKKKGQEE